MWLSGFIFYFTAFSLHCTMTSVYEGHCDNTNIFRVWLFHSEPSGGCVTLLQILHRSSEPHAADTQCLVAEREGQIIKLNDNVTQWMSVVTKNLKLSSGLIQQISFQLNWKMPEWRSRRRNKNKRMSQMLESIVVWALVYFYYISNKLTHYMLHYSIPASYKTTKLVVTDCIVSVNKFRMRFQGCQVHLNGSSHS